MRTIRKAQDRGHIQYDWLDTYHSFSFGSYHDPAHMGFGALRVINEDVIAPAGGFDTHPHRNMEIITYVLEGALAHKDSLGNGSVIQRGDVQRMSAGTGIRHSEANASEEAPVHLLQIWILPEADGLPPSYEQKNFTAQRQAGVVTLLASRDGRDGSVLVHQDVNLSVLDLTRGAGVTYPIATGRVLWAQIARGTAHVGDLTLSQGDGLAVTDEDALHFTTENMAEILLFDMKG